MMGMREKLIELVGNVRRKVTAWHTAEDIADMLIANGVTIPVYCKDCKHWDEETGFCDELSQFYNHGFDWYTFDADDFCSMGERRTDV